MERNSVRGHARDDERKKDPRDAESDVIAVFPQTRDKKLITDFARGTGKPFLPRARFQLTASENWIRKQVARNYCHRCFRTRSPERIANHRVVSITRRIVIPRWRRLRNSLPQRNWIITGEHIRRFSTLCVFWKLCVRRTGEISRPRKSTVTAATWRLLQYVVLFSFPNQQNSSFYPHRSALASFPIRQNVRTTTRFSDRRKFLAPAGIVFSSRYASRPICAILRIPHAIVAIFVRTSKIIGRFGTSPCFWNYERFYPKFFFCFLRP